ncbi:MAG TPA: 3-oxoacyl-[acyl-carrier-protein] reductase [Syntrophorhabdus sp.]|jgi:3-oxoacyl-[acyl-carrier protein] reductase|nr:3-oxoacyl-[acyl-carrier-protein] reductase [Syntrophorhabdus sp.]OPX97144.1 MAG: 3-oxoacyl-(acyl-carrier-protein) reductase FabG [Syntrophorhabdus sp. PtaB.Bin027]MBP8744953.1 3-oxoacyl-[acyl-carrier-protein] reductase [Syntrophorhabdus sp.]HNQ46037.1 3-oxoacyl-[acyl-carrier-protein] reductase [Syntrophorhabdus sp.]HOD77227.1 3-oxoacyl-[acyl-carrier-protein] reductase [Syntrophorhabdus sp.]
MKDTVTIVTGGSQGIGRSIAEFLAAKGGDVVIFDIADSSDIVQYIRQKGQRSEFYQIDVSNFNMVGEAVDKVIKDMGRVSNLVNNAGITADKLLLRMKEEDWDRVLQINLKSAFNCTKAVVRYMLKTGGSIVNISSIAGVMGNAGQANYAASKAGLIGFTKSVAREYGERGIRVNAVAPGFIKTRMTESLDEKSRETMFKAIPLGRLGEPDDIAHVVYFLLSEYGSYITGEVINVNGGLYM